MTDKTFTDAYKREQVTNKALIVQPSTKITLFRFIELWEYRELLYFLIWRDLKIRYKQTLFGAAWIIFQPLISTVVFTIIFGYLIEVPSEGIPYPVFTLTALIPWTYFASSLTKSSTSLVMNSNLITKIYFPRLIIPISAVLSGLVDLTISIVLLVLVVIAYKIKLSLSILFIPIFVFLAVITALGFSLWLSALNVKFRDVNYLVPFLVQIWMYATPVIYSPTLIPEPFRYLLALNPMTGVIEGFRWAVLGQSMGNTYSEGLLFIISMMISIGVLLGGVIFFRRMEKIFADII